MDNRSQQTTTREERAHALDQMLRRHRTLLLRHSARHARGAEQAEEALGDACVSFMRYWERSVEHPDPLPWMLVVTKRSAWALARRQRRSESQTRVCEAELDERALEEVLSDSGPGPAELILRGEDCGRLISAIEGLKRDQRTALILLGLGCSYAEIAELRGWTYTKVNRCIAEGRAAVRAAIGKAAE